MCVWAIKPADEFRAREIAERLNLSPIEARLLVTRGVLTAEDAFRFLSPSFEDLHDPFLFREMGRAAELLHAALTGGERILVHGDYDADGVCGTALLYGALRELGADVHYFVPDRARDGYGLARRVMERGFDVGLRLVVSVDCGSSDGEVIGALKDRGISVIVTDHHEVGERVPGADAFINPKLPGETYPFAELAGAGVAFKLLQGLERRLGANLSLRSRLDLVALGSLGDFAVMRGENRILVPLGLEVLREWRRPGLRALRAESGLAPEGFSAKQVSFTIVPRLNSPGRMGSARDVVELLVTGEEREAGRIAAEIEEKNRRRRVHDSQVTEEACYLADIVLRRSEPHALVFSSSSWHEGVVGIGASRLAERYRLPAVLIAVKDGYGKGSVRSAGVVNVKEVLSRCSDHLIEYGGHREAGGFSIHEDAIPDFQHLFEEVVAELSDGTAGEASHDVDAETTLGECDARLASFVERLGPFGPGNHEPLLLVRRLEALRGSREVGDGHLKMEGVDPQGVVRDLIGFGLAGTWRPKEIAGRRFDALLHMRKNTYQGRSEPQLTIVALRPCGSEAAP